MFKRLVSFRFSVIVITIFFLVSTSWAYENSVFSLHFVDEEDNMIVGKYLTQGEKLYSDIFSNHQPLSYVASAVLQEVTDQNTIFQLIKRHREAVILWSFLWYMLLAWKFRWRIFPFIVCYELTKHFLLGNLFLAESIAVYPLTYVVLLLFDHQKITKKELISIFFCCSLLFFLLSALWPSIVFLIFVFYLKSRKYIELSRFVVSLLIGFLPITVIIFLFSSVTEYVTQTLFINLFYYIPYVSDKNPFSLLLSFISPFVPFFSLQTSPISWILRFVTFIFIICCYQLVNKREYKVLAFQIILLGLLNIRYIEPGVQYYSGFHLLPWFGVFLTLSTSGYRSAWKKRLSIVWISLIASIILICSYFAMNSLFKDRNIQDDFFINYSTFNDYALTIQGLIASGDTVFAAAIEPLVYFGVDKSFRTKYTYYFNFMDKVPSIHTEVTFLFEKDPPEIFFCECYGAPYLQKYLNKYHQVIRNGAESFLYLSKEKMTRLTTEQKKLATFYGFEL